MTSKWIKLDSFPWDSRSVDKTSKCEGKKLDKFFFPKVECTATAVLCCSLTAVPAVLSSLDKKPLYGSIGDPVDEEMLRTCQLLSRCLQP